MKAAYIQQPGPPESIVYGDLPEPQPTASQVLVKVGAVAVNPVDTYVRSGAIAFELPKPFIVGCDLAGTVASVGDQVTRFKPGDRVTINPSAGKLCGHCRFCRIGAPFFCTTVGSTNSSISPLS